MLPDLMPESQDLSLPGLTPDQLLRMPCPKASVGASLSM